jgi:hypothetical protein
MKETNKIRYGRKPDPDLYEQFDSDSFCAAAHDITGAEVCWRHLATFHTHGHQLAMQDSAARIRVLYTHLKADKTGKWRLEFQVTVLIYYALLSLI